jgi:hypothetical protein
MTKKKKKMKKENGGLGSVDIILKELYDDEKWQTKENEKKLSQEELDFSKLLDLLKREGLLYY